MRITIDGAGRIVVPKPLRAELGLTAGTVLEVRVADGRLELEPAPAELRLERRGAGLVAMTDEPLPPVDVEDVRAVRESTRR